MTPPQIAAKADPKPRQENKPLRTPLNLRIKQEDRSIIDRAAKLRKQNRTAFVLEAALVAAKNTLLDQTAFQVSPSAYAEFLALLDKQPQPSERLRKTMQAIPPWEDK